MSGEMQESFGVTTVPNDVWFQVCLYLSVKSLYMLRATSRELRETVDSRTVWLSVLTDLMRTKPSAYSKQDVEDMSAAELRKASLRIVLVDRAYSSPTLPHREVVLFSREDVVGCTQTLLFPGGERLLILRASGSFTIYDISARKTVVDIPPTNTRASSQRSTSTAQLFPTSLYTGHIVIHLSPPFEFGPGPAVAEELRVYEYTADSVRHILTEKMATSVLHFGHAFYHQDGVLSIAQLHLPDANDMSSLELHLRTFVAGGRDERVLKRFRIDELRPEPNNAHPSWKLEILSSRYLILQAKHRALLFDVSQSRGHDSTREITTLHSIWRSPAEIQLMYLPVQPTPYYYSGHRPFVRVALWAEPATVYFLDVPVAEDLQVDDDIPLSRVELSTPNTTRDEDGDTTMFNKMYRGISHGILRLPLYSFHYVSNRPLPRMTIDQEGLWSYSAIRRYGEDESGMIAGCLRLGREDNLQEVRLGNTLQPWKEASKDDEAKELCVDDISGRFVQLKPTYSGLSAVESAGIVLYTLDNIE